MPLQQIVNKVANDQIGLAGSFVDHATRQNFVAEFH
jgi:hypothetical protein